MGRFHAGTARTVSAAGLAEARALSDELFEIVRPEAFYDRPIPERHRIIFYLGHLEAFDWNLLGRELLGLNSFAPEFDKLFAFGIDPVDGGLPTTSPRIGRRATRFFATTRAVRTVAERRAGERAGGRRRRTPANASQLLHVAIEHRLMHVETLATCCTTCPSTANAPGQVRRLLARHRCGRR